MNIKLYVSTFGFKCGWIKNAMPIEVGAALRDNYLYPLHDNTGENISSDNAYWGELTGLYWIWKNVKFQEDDIIGFCHYNKILNISRRKIVSIIERGGAGVVLKPVKMVSHTYPNDVYILCNLMQKFYPQYYDAWCQLYDNEGASFSCSNCELFYLRKEDFNAYCSFLFDLLFRVRDAIGNVDRVPYHKRYCAFLGERLLSVYLLANKRKVAYAESIPYKKFPINIVWKIIHILRFDKTSLYKLIREKRQEGKVRKTSYSRT